MLGGISSDFKYGPHVLFVAIVLCRKLIVTQAGTSRQFDMSQYCAAGMQLGSSCLAYGSIVSTLHCVEFSTLPSASGGEVELIYRLFIHIFLRFRMNE